MAEGSGAASPSRRRLSEKALSGLSRLSESIPGRRSSIRFQEAMWDVPRGGHHYVRIHDSTRRCDILFLVPTQHLVQQGMLFSARVHFERPDPGPDFLENCAKAGVPDGWARRALSAGRRLPEDVYEWVQQQQQHPPASGCKMTIIEEVPPGEFASTTLSSGEHVRVELPAGAIAGQELLFVLPPTTPEGHAEEVTAACFAKKKGPRSLTGKRSWQGRWFELTSTAVQYFEVGADAEVLSRSVIPLSSLEAFRPHDSDDIRLDLQLQDGTIFAIKLDSNDRRELWVRYLQTLVVENLARIQREERLLAVGAMRRTSTIEADVRSSSMPRVAEGQGGEEAEEEDSISGRGEQGFGAGLGSVELDEEAEKERVDALFFRV